MDGIALMDRAMEARQNAYAPYSGFAVGAAVLGEDGQVYTGCNMENASYGLSLCAERAAIACAVGRGNRKIAAIAVAGGPVGQKTIPCPPCGACRQVMQELGGPKLRVLLEAGEGGIREYSLRELLPHAFAL